MQFVQGGGDVASGSNRSFLPPAGRQRLGRLLLPFLGLPLDFPLRNYQPEAAGEVGQGGFEEARVRTGSGGYLPMSRTGLLGLAREASGGAGGGPASAAR